MAKNLSAPSLVWVVGLKRALGAGRHEGLLLKLWIFITNFRQVCGFMRFQGRFPENPFFLGKLIAKLLLVSYMCQFFFLW